ncbi:hypothetical protein I8752_22740 [Nostocaceae cyanobacterium CENA369]|uniref:Uncharacterized protein n=1 Tax=Dendronalium phyllosphericum CENA369 TaxID=1725256 RepID=A0A8J7LJP7_9NOST|nr:hypothetical protein [Dendronalium phyllosphericum]MBH8575769.1 hypothetical protein [Dendronalium phyllosphericum CENA369]
MVCQGNFAWLKILRVPISPRLPKFRSPEAGAPTSLRVSLNPAILGWWSNSGALDKLGVVVSRWLADY